MLGPGFALCRIARGIWTRADAVRATAVCLDMRLEINNGMFDLGLSF